MTTYHPSQMKSAGVEKQGSYLIPSRRNSKPATSTVRDVPVTYDLPLEAVVTISVNMSSLLK